MIFSKASKFAIERLEQKGHSAYLVGGCVRDFLMGKTPHDFDIATSALPEEIEETFRDCRVIETGLRHGTVTVLYKGETVEITAFRAEEGYLDSRHPDKVVFGVSLYKDLARRDFTMNAIAVDKKGNFIDPFGGMEDIKNKVLRAVGNADDRFSEDALRILRAVRFLSVLGFRADRDTEKAMISKKDLLENISGERKLLELSKTLIAPYFKENAERFIPIYNNIFHGFSLDTAKKIDALPCDIILRLAAAVKDSSTEDLMALKPDGETVKKIKMLLSTEVYLPIDEAACKKLYIKHGNFSRKILEFKGISTKIWDEIYEKNGFFDRENFPIGGKELLAEGLRGEEIGKSLDFLLFAAAENKVKLNREELIKYLKNNS